jgi:hypothetical protein
VVPKATILVLCPDGTKLADEALTGPSRRQCIVLSTVNRGYMCDGGAFLKERGVSDWKIRPLLSIASISRIIAARIVPK